MITVVNKSEEYQIKNGLDEVNMSEMDVLSDVINNKKLGEVNKRIEIIKALGLPGEVANQLGAKSLIEITQHTIMKMDSMDMQRVVEIDGNTYTSFEEDEEFDLSGGELAKIEDIYIGGENISAGIMAVIFKGEDTFADRVKLFSQYFTADIAAPYLAWYHSNIIDTVKDFANDVA